MKGAKREVAIYLRAMNKMGPGTQAAAGELAKISERGDKVFRRVKQVGVAAFTAIATAATLVGAKFEQALQNTASMFITATGGGEALQKVTAELEAQARQLGATTAFSATEAADAMYALASGGMTAAETVQASTDVLMLAGATMNDMTATAELTMSTMRQFGIEASDTARVTNVFAAGIQNSMLNMDRLANAMVYAGPTASALGMSVEQTTGALALLHNAGLKGSIAGTGLRMAFARLMDQGPKLRKVLGGLTIENDGLSKVLNRMQAAGLSAAEMTEMFGARAFNAISALVKTGGAGLDEMTDALTGTSAATEMYEHQMKTLNKQWSILMSGVQESGIAIFKVLQPALMAIVKTAQRFVDQTRGTFVQAFDIIAKAADIGGRLFAKYGETLGQFAVAVAVAATGIYGIVKAHIAWVAITNMTRAAMIRLATANVFLLATTAIAVAITIVVKKMGGWREAMVKVQREAEKLWARISYAFARITLDAQLATDWFRALPEYFGRVWQRVVDTFNSAGATLGRIMKLIVEVLLNPWRKDEIFGEIAHTVTDGMKNIAETAARDIGGVLGPDTIAAHEASVQALKDALDADLSDLDRFYAERIANIGKGGSAPQPEAPKVPGFDASAALGGMQMDRYEADLRFVEDKTSSTSRKIFNVWDQTMRGMSNVAGNAWSAIIETGRSGAEKWRSIFASTRDMFWKMLGEMVKRKIAGDVVMLASEKSTQGAMQAERTETAARGFFAAYSSLPFVGQAFAIAAIAGMFAFLGNKFHSGGMVGGRGGIGSYSEVPAMVQRGEYVMPVAQSRANFDTLEAMRRGYSPVGTAAGGGGLSVAVNVNVAEGSLLLAEDDLAVRRFAERINEEIEERISKQTRRA